MKRILILIALSAVLCATSYADLTEKVRKDTEALCKSNNRVTGSQGVEASYAYLRQELSKLKNAKVFFQEFPVIMPEVKYGKLKIDDGKFAGEHSIYPLWPESVRMNTTPQGGTSGKFIYVGKAKYKELPASSLRGNIAVMEMSAYGGDKKWLRVFDLGAKALIFLGSKDDAMVIPFDQPFFKPRYYLPQGKLATALRKGLSCKGTISVKGDFVEKVARNICLTIKGKKKPSELKPIVVGVSYDGMSVVQGLAPGADSALDAAFLLNMARYFDHNQPERSLVLVFVDAYAINQLGIRQFLSMLKTVPEDLTRQAYEEEAKKHIAEYTEITELIAELNKEKNPLAKIHEGDKYKGVQRLLRDALSPEIVSQREVTGDMRLELSKSENKDNKELKAELKSKDDRLKLLNKFLYRVIITGKLDDDLNEFGEKVWRKISERAKLQLEHLQDRQQFFKKNDVIRQEIYAALGISDGSKSPFTFLFCIDISDCGINIGPSLYCTHNNANLVAAGRDFTRWLKNKLRQEKGLFANIKPEKLAQLSGTQDDPEQLLKTILNIEALKGADFHDMLKKSLSGVEEERIKSIIKIVDKEKPDKVRLLEILKEQLPELSKAQTQNLAKNILNQQSLEGEASLRSFTPEPTALMSAVARGFQMQGVTWTTLEGIRTRLDTPADTFSNIKWARVNPQLIATAMLLELMANDDGLVIAAPSLSGFPKWRMIHGNIVSESVSETIARTPAPNMLTTFTDRHAWYNSSQARGVRGLEFVMTGPDGTFMFAPLHSPYNWVRDVALIKAFKLNEYGEIVKGLAEKTSITSSNLTSSIHLKGDPPLKPIRAVTFDCVEYNSPLMYDPRYQTPLSTAKIIDVERGDTPKNYQSHSYGGQVWALLEPDTKWQLIMRHGTTSVRQALMNIPSDLMEKKMSLRDGLGFGFELDKPIEDIPAMIAAKDFYQVDSWRINLLETSGVSCLAINKLHVDTAKYLEAAEKAKQEDNGQELIRNGNAALSNEIRVYHALLQQVEDVTRGAIFLLMLLVPFAIVMERLLIASVDINKQILYSIIIFVIMGLVLSSFHPGFKITTQPIIILLAFAILILSLAVISMILKKTKSDLAEIRSGTMAEASGAQTGRSGVIGSAVWLGIANMRKRLVRTFLTGATIVLITFSLLCFTSSSTFQDMRKVTLDDIKPNYSGVMLQHPALLVLDANFTENVNNILGYKYPVVGRKWISEGDASWRLHLRNPQDNSLASLKAALIMDKDEDKFCDISEVLPDWKKFAESENGCYISQENAQKLGVKPGDKLVLSGIPLTLTGVFDAMAMEQKLKKLDGQSMLPVDYSLQRYERELSQSAIEASMASGDMVMGGGDNVKTVNGEELIILSEKLENKLASTTRNIAVLTPPEETEAVAEKLMRAQVYPVYYSDGDKVRVMISTPLMPSAPRKILIPIIIAALIIFNTMLNSIAERKKEIHIYSSLGLAPRHIGILFLAEAFTYGLIGSVFGYIFGQGVATILTHFDLMGGITLNYSGSNVIMTMGLVLLIVTLSSLVPAHMAAKVASPSEDSDWKVPQPEDGVIKDQLPFTVSSSVAKGLACFMYDYIDAHKDGAIGNFTSDNFELIDGDGKDFVVALTGTVWLAPYDLGVRQDFRIEIVHDIEDICNIMITLTHSTGQIRTWWKLNRIFLGDLRRQLLGWRNIPQDRIISYIEKAIAKFAT